MASDVLPWRWLSSSLEKLRESRLCELKIQFYTNFPISHLGSMSSHTYRQTHRQWGSLNPIVTHIHPFLTQWRQALKLTPSSGRRMKDWLGHPMWCDECLIGSRMKEKHTDTLDHVSIAMKSISQSNEPLVSWICLATSASPSSLAPSILFPFFFFFRWHTHSRTHKSNLLQAQVTLCLCGLFFRIDMCLFRTVTCTRTNRESFFLWRERTSIASNQKKI